jgi:hypothetical protein
MAHLPVVIADKSYDLNYGENADATRTKTLALNASVF